MIRRVSFLLAVVLLGFLAGCDQSTLPQTQATIGGEKFSLEIAAAENDRRLGLMHRDSLASDHGMLFVFGDDDVRTFWNHEVHFPLDVVFLDSDLRVVSVVHMQAWSDLNVSSQVPAHYAVELNEGTASRLHLDPGVRLEIPPDALKLPTADK